MAELTSRDRLRRGYRSPTRERRARDTRERVLAAAGAEFVRAGYGAATMRAVASAAGVSVPTIEQLFGTKAALLRAAIGFAIRGDAAPVPMLGREWARRARAAASSAELLAVVEPVLVESARRSAALIVAVQEAARRDESMGALADQLRAQRAETAGWIVDRLIGCAPLRHGVNRDRAVDTVWLLMDPHGYRALTENRGWSPEEYGRWFSESVRRLLLDEDDDPHPGE